MIHHVAHLALQVVQNPAWAMARFGTRMRPPLWLRAFAGAVLPPWVGRSRFRSVYVVTYGRSGSTLLTGYLSHLPGFDIKGENFLFPLPLADAEERLVKAAKLPYGDRDTQASPWYGSHQFNPAQWKRDVRRALLNQLYPYRPIPKTIGFKEIRWWYGIEGAEFDAKLRWLTSVRRPGGIVFLTRDLDRTMAGAWWANHSDAERAEARAGLEAFERNAHAYATTHPDHSIHITYEDFCRDSQEAQRLCTMLGVRFRQSVYEQTLGARYSYASRPPADAEH